MAMARVSTQQKLISTYYDTPDSALEQRGLTLRVRDQGGHFVQTVKEEDLASADLLSRGEWEDAVEEGRPDPHAAQSGSRLPEGAAADLRPIFVTEVTRTIFAIEPLPGTQIEAAVDEGEIRAVDKDRAEPVSEVELELKGGEAAALYDLAAQLLEIAPLRIETRSKSERGYRLVECGDAAPPAVHAEPVILDPDMTVESLCKKSAAAALRNSCATNPPCSRPSRKAFTRCGWPCGASARQFPR